MHVLTIYCDQLEAVMEPCLHPQIVLRIKLHHEFRKSEQVFEPAVSVASL